MRKKQGEQHRNPSFGPDSLPDEPRLIANSFATQEHPLNDLIAEGQKKPGSPPRSCSPLGSGDRQQQQQEEEEGERQRQGDEQERRQCLPPSLSFESNLIEEIERPHVPDACMSPTCGGRLVNGCPEGSERFRTLLRLLLEEHRRELAIMMDAKKNRKAYGSQTVRLEASMSADDFCCSQTLSKKHRGGYSSSASGVSDWDIRMNQDFFGGEETEDDQDHGSMCGIISQRNSAGTRKRRSQAGVLLPRSAWLISDEDSDEFHLQHHPKFSIQHGATSNALDSRTVERDPNSWLQPWISLPGSNIRMVLDFIGALFIFYDLLVIPLQAFGIGESVACLVVDWVALVFWTFNMFTSPFVGYVYDGITIIVPTKTILHYFKTWFIVDLITILPDWVFSVLALGSASPENAAHSSVRLLRILRLMRMVRLARVLQLSRIMDDFDAMIDSEYISIVLRVCKMIVYLLIINHMVACIWYTCAHVKWDAEDVDNWVDVHGFHDSSKAYLYWTSLHWSLTQFTPASMSVQPQNKVERVFAVLVVVFALVIFSYLVGSITGSLTQLRSMQENASKQFTNLRRYLRQQKVSAGLRFKLEKYLEHEWQRQQEMLSLKDVTIVKLLSDQLHGELQCALCVPHLSVHPLFLRLESVSKVTLFRLSNTAISRKMLAAGDSLFLAGEMATHMYVCIEGRLRYIKSQVQSEGEGKHMAGIGSYEKVTGTWQGLALPATEWVDSQEDWIAEPILWTSSWRHLGQTISHMKSELLLVDAEKFAEVLPLNPQAMRLACIYASNFLKWMNGIDPQLRSDISQGEIISTMLERFMELDLEGEEDKMLQALSKMSTHRSATSMSLHDDGLLQNSHI